MKPNSTSASTSFTNSHPWDHLITVRRQRRKGKQKVSEMDQDILVEFRSLHIDGDVEEGGEGETDTSVGGGPSSLDTSADAHLEPLGAHVLIGEGVRGRIGAPTESGNLVPSSGPMISPSGIDKAFSMEEFNPSNWVAYGNNLPGEDEDDGTDEDEDEDEDEDNEDDSEEVYLDEYLGDIEQDFNSEASDPVDQGDYPSNIPLQPLIARHIPVDGASETELVTDIVDEDPQYAAFNPGPDSRDRTIPLPNSARFHPSLLDVISPSSPSRWSIPADSDMVSTAFGHLGHRHIGMQRYLRRNTVSLGQDDGVDSSHRGRSSAAANAAAAGNDLGDFSDDSFSGFQLPADAVAELEERKQRRQAEAAKRTVR